MTSTHENPLAAINNVRHFGAPLQRKVLTHMEKTGSISALDAMVHLGITSGSLSKRICELQEWGVKIHRQKRRNQMNGVPYTRYSIKKD